MALEHMYEVCGGVIREQCMYKVFNKSWWLAKLVCYSISYEFTAYFDGEI